MPKALNPFLISFLRAGLFFFLSLLLVSVEPGGVRRERDSGFRPCGAEPGPESRTQTAQGRRGTRRRHPGGAVGAVACVPSKGPLTVAWRTESGTAETPTVRSTRVPALAGETSGHLQVALCRPPDPGCTATAFTPVPRGARTWGRCGPAPGLLPHVQAPAVGTPRRWGWVERGWGPPCWGCARGGGGDRQLRASAPGSPPSLQDPAAPSPPCPAGGGWKWLPRAPLWVS